MTHNLEILVRSLDYIEAHLQEPMKTEDIALFCYTSKSSLEKLFSYVYHISVHSYIIRRRMTKAAFSLIQYPKKSILSIALDYGYQSHEAFSRAFKEVFFCSPSEYRRRHSCKLPALYPCLHEPMMKGDAYLMERTSFDISELYDLFCERKDCYFICADIRDMISINHISRKAGDMAILETLKRLDEAAGENDLVFRIGGDEFCMLTDKPQTEYADSIISDLLSKNGNTFHYDNSDIPLSLHVCHTQLNAPDSSVKYNELFATLHTAIKDCK